MTSLSLHASMERGNKDSAIQLLIKLINSRLYIFEILRLLTVINILAGFITLCLWAYIYV